jgi:DNA modification methylase
MKENIVRFDEILINLTKTENMPVEAKGKIANPSNLPFLQAQILQKIYFELFEQEQTTIEDLSELTDYPKDSKILGDAIEALTEKGFLDGNLLGGFKVPEHCLDLFSKIVKRNDYKHKKYSTNILQFTTPENIFPSLFEEEQTISELNKYGVVHRWYDYLEDFPYSLIEDRIKEYKIKVNSLIVEPFVGSGTTCVAANFFKCNSIGFDANPLMAFISKVKTTWDIDLAIYKKQVIKIARQFLEKIHDYESLSLKKGFLECMPKKELNQWLRTSLQKEVNLLKNLIDEVTDNKVKNLLLLALSKSCLDASYVSFCPGTTFYPFREKEEFWDLFTRKTIQIYEDLEKVQKHNHYGKSTLINDTCLNAPKYIKPKSIDFIITSPPYPNDLEYTRQTRLEMYLLDFVKSMDEVQQVKKKMVKGSTKLIFKESKSESFALKFNDVKIVSDKIYEQTKDKNWGFDYPRMVREYFGDMYLCLKEFYPLMKKNSHFLLVVGDQTVKGVYIPVCDILIEMAQEIGYRNCRKELFRMRRSTGHNVLLPEEIVIIEK